MCIQTSTHHVHIAPGIDSFSLTVTHYRTVLRIESWGGGGGGGEEKINRTQKNRKGKMNELKESERETKVLRHTRKVILSPSNLSRCLFRAYRGWFLYSAIVRGSG